MDIETLKKIIDLKLVNMGCSDILFSEIDSEGAFFALFNANEITSFSADLQGWLYSGIHLDNSKKRKYKIDFKKIT